MMDPANNMAHYIDDDIITSHHLLSSKDVLRSRGNRSLNGLTKRKISVPKPDKEAEALKAAEKEAELERERRELDLKERRLAIRARYVKCIKKRKLPRSPFGIKPSKDFSLAFFNVPLVSRILVTGVLLTVLSLTTPFWAYVRSYNVAHATFGLWHFCIGSSCWSIHDNLIHGRDVPLWYMVSQMTFTIGVICASLAMFVVTSNHVGNQVKLSPTTNSTMVMMLVVGVLQMSTGLYTFTSYFEDVSFMYEYSEDVEEVDFYGSFWLGVTGTALILIAAMMLFFDEEIMPYHEKMMFLHGTYVPPQPGYYSPQGYSPQSYSPQSYSPPSSPPPGYRPEDYPDGGYLPDLMRGYQPNGYPENYQGYPPEAYMPEGYMPEGCMPEGYMPEGYPVGEYPPGVYPDNALFNDMPMWDEQMRNPIVSQSEVPCARNPTSSAPRPKRFFKEDYLKKST